MAKLLAGYGECEITPPLGTPMTGYGHFLDRRVTSVHDPLKARTVVLASGETRLILVSCDLLGLTVAFSDQLRQAIGYEHGILPQQVLIACTHTHGGPASQPLLGMGAVEPLYLAAVGKAITQSVSVAVGDLQEAELSYALDCIEPIGINRRTQSFTPIDPLLKVIYLQRRHEIIHLVSYACHAVVFGVEQAVTADWPGSVISQLEAHGHKGIVLQGFCGDVNPVTVMSHGWENAADDVEYYGDLICHRLERGARYAVQPQQATLHAAELRIDLPLEVLTGAQVAERQRQFREVAQDNPPLQRFLEAWAAATRQCLPEFVQTPYLAQIPVQAMTIGEVELLGLPGEVYCNYDLQLRKRHPALFSVGYANGNIGYLPTQDAFAQQDDYGAYLAPMLYQLHAFTPRVETILLHTCKRALAELSPGSQKLFSNC